jgi:transposase
MSDKGKRYDRDFKEGAIRLVLVNKRPVSSVAADLGVNTQTLYRWLKEHNEGKNGSETGRIAELEAELRAEKRRIADLEETVAILKKATAIFANPRK